MGRKTPKGNFKPPAPAVTAPSIESRLGAFRHAARGAFSGNTERALRADVERFTDWCDRQGLCALPARAATVAGFIDAMARERAPATVRRYVASIGTAHKAIGADSPLEHVTVQLALQRMHRKKGRRQDQVQGLTWALIQRLMQASGARLIDLRNRAMLAVAYDTMVRRSELVALQVLDLMIEPDGSASLLVRRGKTDAFAEGAIQYLHRDSVKLVEAWLEGAGIDAGALFRSVRKDGTQGVSLDPSQVPRIYKAMGRRARLPAEVVQRLSGHSPRVGAAQDMIAYGIGMPAILQAGRWKSTAMVHRYGEGLLARRSGTAQLARLQDRK